MIIFVISNPKLIWVDVLFFKFLKFCFRRFTVIFSAAILDRRYQLSMPTCNPIQSNKLKNAMYQFEDIFKFWRHDMNITLWVVLIYICTNLYFNLKTFANESKVWECSIWKYQISRYDVINWILPKFERFDFS